MASVIRMSHGGGAAVEESHLTIEQAQSMAKSLATVGEPAGCCWSVGLWDLEEEGALANPLVRKNARIFREGYF
jgi:hypothetical protein